MWELINYLDEKSEIDILRPGLGSTNLTIVLVVDVNTLGKNKMSN